jgi:hypothetical protein
MPVAGYDGYDLISLVKTAVILNNISRTPVSAIPEIGDLPLASSELERCPVEVFDKRRQHGRCGRLPVARSGFGGILSAIVAAV